MNKQEKKIAIVNNLLDIANNSEKDHKHNFSDVTFFCPGIGNLVDGANAVLVKNFGRTTTFKIHHGTPTSCTLSISRKSRTSKHP